MKRLAVTLLSVVLLAGPAFAGDKEEKKLLSAKHTLAIFAAIGADLVIIQARQAALLDILQEIVNVMKKHKPPTCKGLSSF